MEEEYSSSDDENLQELLANPGLYAEEKKHVFINNHAALKSTLLELKNDLPWLERLDLSSVPVTASDLEETIEVDANDDFKREAMFCRQAQSAVVEGLARLKKAGVTTRRPTDYFTEMVKDDSHMVKVRQFLLSKQKQLDLREKAKKLREMRKFGKKAQQEASIQKNAKKKEFLESVKRYKKAPELNNLDDILEGKPTKQAPGPNNRAQNKTPNRNKNFKRNYKNKQYGFGGQKKRSKQNTTESFSNVKSFSRLKHQSTPLNAARIKKDIKNQKKKTQKKSRK